MSFKSIEAVLWLPGKVGVEARAGGVNLHSVHRYSDYHLYGIDDDKDPEQKAKNTGIPPAAAADTEDSCELLARAIGLMREEKPAEAGEFLRKALALDSARPELRYHLGVALRTTGDLVGAEAELREAAKSMPGSAPAHNNLGILLFQRENVPGALAEFREASRLEPKDPTAHVNLARALAKQGDTKAAVEEYRAASLLAPNDVGLKARYEELAAMQSAGKAPVSETTIKVDVRQVLVPLIVTDKEGHHITGLKQEDFRGMCCK